MEKPDEAIERVLAGLRDAEAPAGMERRILEAVREGAPGRREWRLAGAWPLAGVRTWALAAGVVVVSSIACWAAFHGHNPGRRGPGSDSTVSKTHTVAENPPAQRAAMVAAGRARPALPARTVVRARIKTNGRRSGSVREEESALLHEVRYGNHPAPEAPLTDQEKLLLRLAHRADPVEMAALNPVLWAKRDAEEKAEVKRFFEPAGDDK